MMIYIHERFNVPFTGLLTISAARTLYIEIQSLHNGKSGKY